MKIRNIDITRLDADRITSYDQLLTYRGKVIDVEVIDRRDNQIKHNVYKKQWITVVDNPNADFNGVVISNSPQSIDITIRVTPEADFELNTFYIKEWE